MQYSGHKSLRHSERGAVSLAKSGDGFLLAFNPGLHLDSSHVVVGRVTAQSAPLLDKLNDLQTLPDDSPALRVGVARCGSTDARGAAEVAEPGAARDETPEQATARIARETEEASAIIQCVLSFLFGGGGGEEEGGRGVFCCFAAMHVCGADEEEGARVEDVAHEWQGGSCMRGSPPLPRWDQTAARARKENRGCPPHSAFSLPWIPAAAVVCREAVAKELERKRKDPGPGAGARPGARRRGMMDSLLDTPTDSSDGE